MQCGDLYYSNLTGLGALKLFTYGKVECVVKIRNRVRMISALILPDDILPTPLLLGRDCLSIFEIKLKFCATLLNTQLDNSIINDSNVNLIKDSCAINLINHCFHSVRGDIVHADSSVVCELESTENLTSIIENPLTCTTALSTYEEPICMELPYIFAINLDNCLYDVGASAGVDTQGDCRALIERVYESRVDPNIAVPSVHEMQIRLSTDTPFHCPPRRLSVFEKREVQRITDELLNEGIIRPSDSPFASPIVLVKKKKWRNSHVRRLQRLKQTNDSGQLPASTHRRLPRVFGR